MQAGQPNGFSELSMYHVIQQISRRAFTAAISFRLTFSFMPPQVLPGAVRVSSLSAQMVQSLSILLYSPLDGCTSARRSCMGRFLSAVHPVPDPSSCSECCLLVRCCYRAGLESLFGCRVTRSSSATLAWSGGLTPANLGSWLEEA